ncbi:hypothetical protein [Seonamhaeicola sp. S2-3]|uniref:hypothetical protein n=1 Tax=Seonamhaeicola sp. S2-3 TaxID=1936081 RepID=UPI0012F9795D|nr:hypothetical protein [Seonamhaeicola sp. S2-3]
MEIFLNWKNYNLNMLPEDIKKEYNEKIIPSFGFDKEAHFLKSFFKILKEKLFNQPLLFKTESYNYFQGDNLNHSEHSKAYYSQIERYIQGYKEGLKLRSSLNCEKLFRQLKIDFNNLDYSEYFKYNGDNSLIVLVDENTPQEFYSFPIDLYEYGKKTGYFINCWELLLKEYYPIIHSDSFNKSNLKKTKKYKHLLNIGIALAKGELDKYLVISKTQTIIGNTKSFNHISVETGLDEQYLKCTIKDYNEGVNKTKNLRHNTEIIDDVLKRLQNENCKPSLWFLNHFNKT